MYPCRTSICLLVTAWRPQTGPLQARRCRKGAQLKAPAACVSPRGAQTARVRLRPFQAATLGGGESPRDSRRATPAGLQCPRAARAVPPYAALIAKCMPKPTCRCRTTLCGRHYARDFHDPCPSKGHHGAFSAAQLEWRSIRFLSAKSDVDERYAGVFALRACRLAKNTIGRGVLGLFRAVG